MDKFKITIATAAGEEIHSLPVDSYWLSNDQNGVRLRAPYPEPKMISDDLDSTPLGTAAEERQRAKLWMEDAGRYARNEAYWREKRAYPAEECVRMLGRLLGFCGDFPGQLSGSPLLTLHDHVVSWGRPENPEQYHEVPTESAKIDDLKWLDNVVPRTASVGKPFAEQKVSKEFSSGRDPDRVIQEAAAYQRDSVNQKAKQLIRSWLDKQGHDRCWYYPEIFRELADLFGLKPTVDPQLPSVEAFQGGCQRYQLEQYGKAAAPTVVTDADVTKLIELYGEMRSFAGDPQDDAGDTLIAKMRAAIAENAKAGKPEGVLISRERLDQLEHAEDNLRVLKEHETHSRSMSFAELLDIHQRGAASLQHIGYLFLAAMREDKCFTIKMGPTVEITGSTSTDERPINAFGYTDPRETEKPKRRVIIQGEGRIFNHFETDEVQTIDEGFGNYSLRFKVAGVSQLKIVQGANGDYFVQHKSGLWRIQANGTIGSGDDAAESFREVLKELGTPAGSNGTPSEAEKEEFLQSHQTDLGTDE